MRIFASIFGKIISGLRSFFDVNGAASNMFWGYGGRRVLDPEAESDAGDRLFGSRTEEWMRRGKRRYAITQEPE